MTPYEKRRLELEHQDWRLKCYDFEQRLAACDDAIARIKGRLRSINRSLDLTSAAQRRSVIVTQLAEARAREASLALQLGPPRGQFDDIREREIAGLASAALVEQLGIKMPFGCAASVSVRRTTPGVRIPKQAAATSGVTKGLTAPPDPPDLNFRTAAQYRAWAKWTTLGLPR